MHHLARRAFLASAVASVLLAAAASAQDRAASGTQGDYVTRDFRFADGSVLPELRIHYVTLGAPKRDASGTVRNAVLILHGTTGNGGGFLRPQFAGSCSARASCSIRQRTTSSSPMGSARAHRANRATASTPASRTTAIET